MIENIKRIGSVLVYYVNQIPRFIVAVPSFLDKLVYNGLGMLHLLVTEKLKVQNVSCGWNIWRFNLLNNQLEPDESSEPFSPAVHSAKDKPHTAPLVNMAYKMGVIMFLGGVGLTAVIFLGPLVAVPLGIMLGVVSLLHIGGYMDPRLYKLLLNGLMIGLGMALIIGLSTLFPPLLALPVVGGMLAMLLNSSILLINVGIMFALSLLATSIAGIVDNGAQGLRKALNTVILFPLYASVYTGSAVASFMWDLCWWPFHGFYFQVYDPVRNWVREKWPQVKDTLGEKWASLREVLGQTSVVSWIRGHFAKFFNQPEFIISGKMVEPDQEETTLKDFAEENKDICANSHRRSNSGFWSDASDSDASDKALSSSDDSIKIEEIEEEEEEASCVNGFNSK